MGSKLDEFLDGPARAGGGEQPQPDFVHPMGDPSPQPEPTPQSEPVDDEGAPPAPNEPSHVPRDALIAERRQRQDWKEKANKYEGQLTEKNARLAEVERQLQELRKAPPAPPATIPARQEPSQPPQVIAPPNPIEDPDGFHRWNDQRLFNERLNMSEAMLRQQHGDDEVNAAIERFKRAADENPALKAQLAQQVHPWKWAYDQAKRFQALEEFGPDPSAYRAKLKAEFRAEFEAEQAAARQTAEQAVAIPDSIPTTPPPAAQLPQSLATARSSAPRSAPAYSGPTPLEELLKPKSRR